MLRIGAKFVNMLLPEYEGLIQFDQFFPDFADKEGGRELWVFGKDPAKHKPYFLAEYFCGEPPKALQDG